MQQQQLLPSYKLTLKELLSRPNFVIVSEQGMKLRTAFREQTRSMSPIPKKNSNATFRNEKSMEMTSGLMKIGNQSFYQAKQKDTIYNNSHLKTKIKKPYDQRLMERLANKIQRVETTNQTNQNKIQEFYQTINQSQQLITQAVIESKLDKLHENYQIELKKREFTQKHIQEILRQQKLYSQRQIELYDSNFERPRHKEIEESYYKDPKYLKRKQIRLHDYQKNKYEKYWKLQPMLGKLQN